MKFFKPLGRLAAVTKPRARMLFVSFVLICWWITASIHRQAAHPRDFSFHDIHHPWNEISTFKDTPSTPLNASKLALIVEPRPLPVLVPLILHMIAVVPPDWRFLFIGSPWNIYSLGKSRSIRYQRDRGKIELMKLPKPWRLDLDEDVSRLLTDIRFYDEFIPDVEWVFKFEHDSILCANSPTSLDDWLSWSWAGMSR
ncbi:hypothetical protein QQS21_007350 [Conoideocrella luteorostrata]|uniref:DUF5672 domain-containing protein n=1 Tax=Conoideocrella luteorostrata TaxID=1105319 RepID=A0AAJ0CLR1_9HYPO|nr:hypothetical protein QQS21_007350 [Conoideocrella luteorostrata]